jgi:hypothetical protein
MLVLQIVRVRMLEVLLVDDVVVYPGFAQVLRVMEGLGRTQ